MPTWIKWAHYAWGYDGVDPPGQDSLQNTPEEYSLAFVDWEDTTLITQQKDLGKYVICYFSQGSIEPWRSDVDTSAPGSPWEEVKVGLKKGDVAEPWADGLGPWADGKMGQWDEWWIDPFMIDDSRYTSGNTLKTLVGNRLDAMQAAGCDGVEPDNSDCYDNDACRTNVISGDDTRDTVYEAQKRYNLYMVDQAHARGMAIGLKNSMAVFHGWQLTNVDTNGDSEHYEPYDFAVNEQCNEYSECGAYSRFMNVLNKPVFHTEYTGEECTHVGTGLSTIWCDGNEGLCNVGTFWQHCDLTGESNIVDASTYFSSVLPTQAPTLPPEARHRCRPCHRLPL